MTTKYQKSQIEDVAVLLHFHHDINVSGPIAIATLAGHFADLFAADNPPICPRCGRQYRATNTHIYPANCSGPHEYEGGFDREQFLAACGLRVG